MRKEIPFHLLRVVKLMNVGRLRGFVLELDGDGYTILRTFSVE
jgi:hypothetical protein